MKQPLDSDILIAGGGAAGFFAAIHCLERNPELQLRILELSPRLMSKVSISGGGRCNVTHACPDPRNLAQSYPRGHRELLGPFHRWNATHTIEWFEARGVRLKTEADGRMFPVTDSSKTVTDCLEQAARKAGAHIITGLGVRSASVRSPEGFDVTLSDGSVCRTRQLMLATGGNPRSGGWECAEALGLRMVPPVPSLFTFNIADPELLQLPGVTVPSVTVYCDGCAHRETGPLLVTHWGLSGPAVLKLSSWAARDLHALDYKTDVIVDFMPRKPESAWRERVADLRRNHGSRMVINTLEWELPRRMWEFLVTRAGVPPGTTWSRLGKDTEKTLGGLMRAARFNMVGKSTNKDEFVTAGGIALDEINFKTFEARRFPGLFAAGEILDIDGITGGFNFQAAWTGGALAGSAMAEKHR